MKEVIDWLGNTIFGNIIVILVIIALFSIIAAFIIAFVKNQPIVTPLFSFNPHPKNEVNNGPITSSIPDQGNGFKFGGFSDFDDEFSRKISESEQIVLFFIHSRRWRENHLDVMATFLGKRNSKLVVYLPNMDNQALISTIQVCFNDGPDIPSLIRNAYRHFSQLSMLHPTKVEIRPFDIYPVYSFYKFDESVIMALYHNGCVRSDVPTFHIQRGHNQWAFFVSDLQWLADNTSPLTKSSIQKLAK